MEKYRERERINGVRRVKARTKRDREWGLRRATLIRVEKFLRAALTTMNVRAMLALRDAEMRARLRRCRKETCGRWFFDVGRANRRRYCNARCASAQRQAQRKRKIFQFKGERYDK